MYRRTPLGRHTVWLLFLAAAGLLLAGQTTWAASIRRVQSGEVTFSGTTQDVTISTLNDSTKAILIFNERVNSASPNQAMVRGNILNGTTLHFVKNASGTSVTVRWYAAEFDSGVTVQRGTATQGSTTTNVTITGVNLAESFILVSRERNGTTFSSNGFLRSSLTTATNLEMALNSGTGGTDDWQVVSFTGASVQRGTLTLASGSLSTTQAITAVDTTRSFLLFSYNSPSGVATNISQKMVQGWLSTGSQISFSRDTAGVAINLAWEVVQLPTGNVVQEKLQNFTTATTSVDVPISAVDTNHAVAFSASQSMYGQSWGKTPFRTDDNPGTGSFTMRLLSATSVRTQRASSGVTGDVPIFTIDFHHTNFPPVLAPIGPKSVNEGQNLNFIISATDPDGTIPTFTAENVPANATLTGNGNGTATFDFNPDFTQSGVYNVRFICSDGSLTDSEVVAITVNNVNRNPVLAAIGAKSVNEGQNLNFIISATDPDGTIPTF
ncbi:MAG: hypothetical protein HY304_08530, partial [candidate division Zixibacteria bacterium]|nr:hypothetical protein [candidate division Zixibacteria bacterium]